jgi:hypothetical protein
MEIDVQIYDFLTSGLVGGKWPTSRPSRFTLAERSPCTHWAPEPIWTIWRTEHSWLSGLERRLLGIGALSQSLHRLLYVTVWYIVLFAVSGYRFRGPVFCSRHYQIFWEVVGLERRPLSLVSTTEELQGTNSSGSGPENLEYGRRDPLCWPRDTLYPQKFALTSPKSGGCLVRIVLSRTKATEFVVFFYDQGWTIRRCGWGSVLVNIKHLLRPVTLLLNNFLTHWDENGRNW